MWYGQQKKGDDFERQISVCGIYQKGGAPPKQINNSYLATAYLCDPISNKQIGFNLFTNQFDTSLEQGSLVILHNVLVEIGDRTKRLRSGRRTYLVDETKNKHEYFRTLQEYSRTKKWI